MYRRRYRNPDGTLRADDLQTGLRTGTIACRRPLSAVTSPYKVNLKLRECIRRGQQPITAVSTRQLQTCEAVVDMIASKSCTVDSSCGNGQGGLCKNFAVSGAPTDLRCTIPCVAASECLAPPVLRQHLHLHTVHPPTVTNAFNHTHQQ